VDRIPGAPASATPDQRARLQVSDTTELRYRRVQLRCGTRLLSDAENWYVPSRLTPEMNRLLDSTNTPFGRVVQPLAPYRRTFADSLLWMPLPAGWDRSTTTAPCASAGPLRIPPALFEHRALMYGSDQRPIAELREVYQGSALGAPPRGPC
jgi:hypothetical protein